MTMITQARVARCVEHFREDFLRKFDLAEYHSPHEPAIFFGCYDGSDVEALLTHRSAKIVIWGGTDAMDRELLRLVRAVPECYHVVISDFIAADLDAAGIEYVRLPVTPVDHDLAGFAPCPKGDAIYCYTSAARPEFYGQDRCEQLQEEFPEIEFTFCKIDSRSREELLDLYRRSFMGLRLLEHDGLSNTVIELALMGRHTVHNGGLSGSLAYDNLDDVRRHIRQQRETIGLTDMALSEAARKSLELPEDWLTLDFYQTRCPQRQPSWPVRLAVTTWKRLRGQTVPRWILRRHYQRQMQSALNSERESCPHLLGLPRWRLRSLLKATGLYLITRVDPRRQRRRLAAKEWLGQRGFLRGYRQARKNEMRGNS